MLNLFKHAIKDQYRSVRPPQCATHTISNLDLFVRRCPLAFLLFFVEKRAFLIKANKNLRSQSFEIRKQNFCLPKKAEFLLKTSFLVIICVRPSMPWLSRSKLKSKVVLLHFRNYLYIHPLCLFLKSNIQNKAQGVYYIGTIYYVYTF